MLYETKAQFAAVVGKRANKKIITKNPLGIWRFSQRQSFPGSFYMSYIKIVPFLN
ncbi:hypothetical protein TcasGA2_TC015090 [Tribolium castaneum]|uniref:Uncharacterized protein n=1 Tax=Tribolium castaneum TaxID=7070 RepID=D2A5Y4_TRICA|nr:hypothetical protein TcasGA2_TC015090 [Tribolium castaneum]